VSDKQAQAAERQKPRRPWLWPLAGWAIRRLAARRTEHGDERPLSIGPFWLHVYRWGSKGYGTGRWYEDWHALVGWRGGYRSIYLCDAPESKP
jgi:hypothetical protein